MDAIVRVHEGHCLDEVELRVEIAYFEVSSRSNHAGTLVIKDVNDDELEQLKDVVGPSGTVTRLSTVSDSWETWE
jgi:hypothetical protein